MKKPFLYIVVLAAIGALLYGFYVERETLVKKEEQIQNQQNQPKADPPLAEEKVNEPPIDEKAYDAAMSAAFKYKSAGDSGDAASYQKAIEEYKKAAAISRNTVWMPFLNLGNTYRLVKDYKNAESAYDKALNIEPAEGSLYAAKIDLYRYYFKKSPEEMMKLYDVAISKVVANGNLVVSYAGYFEEIGEYADALKWYKVLYEQYPESVLYKQKIQELEEKSKRPTSLIPVRLGRGTLNVELADSEYAQTRGLTGRAFLPKNQAVLYAVTKQQEFSYWAKDMLFATDVIWIGPDFNIVDITENIAPSSYPEYVYKSKEPARYVIEANAGTAARLGVKIGETVELSKIATNP